MKIRGKVIKGDQKGKGQGFPTANLNPRLAKKVTPGVYAGEAFYKQKKCPAILIYGAPDKKNRPKLEVFFLGKCENIYGKIIEAEIKQKIRPLIKFKNKTEFTKQVLIDISLAKKLAYQKLKKSL